MKKAHPQSSEPDGVLIEHAQHGDQRAFTKLVRRYEDTVFSFAFQACRNREKAEETLQDTFVNVYRKIHQFDGRSKFTTWVYKIVVNNCLMKRRKSKLDRASISIGTPEGFRNEPLIDDEGNVVQTIPSWKETPHDIVAKKELQTHLDKAMLRLPMEYRIVFILKDVEEKSAQEIAEILNLSIPAVKSRLSRARAFLRQELHAYMKS